MDDETPTPEEILRDENVMTFPQFYMTFLWSPGDDKQHVFESLLAQGWAINAHAHVFQLEFKDETGWQAFWIAAPPEYWMAMIDSLREQRDAEFTSLLEGEDDNA